MKRLLCKKGAYLLLLILFSCTSEFEKNFNNSEEIHNIVMQTTGFRAESSSRTYPNISNGYVDILWHENDVVGVFPNEGSQAAFPMSSSAGKTQASFNGGGWALKSSYKYAAYYPYEFNNRDYTKIPVSYLGQKQIGKNTSTHTGAYNYMVANANTPLEGKVNFTFQNMGSMIIMQLTVPQPTTLSTVILSAEGINFPTKGTIDIMAESPVITPIAYSGELRIDLESFTTTDYNEIVTIYIMTAPINLSGKTIKVQVYDSKGNLHVTDITGKNLEAGGFYSLKGTLPNIPTISNVFTLSQAGELAELISDTQKSALTEIKIIGDINADDILFIREMLGRDIGGNEILGGNLQKVDLSETNIVEGGTTNYKTEQDIIPNYMFEYCDKLTEIRLPSNIKSIGVNAFRACKNLKNIIIPNNVTSIGNDAFSYCSNLSTIVLPNNLEYIGNYVFMNSGLKTITIPDNVEIESDGQQLFSDCGLLETVILPKNIKVIGGSMFHNCYKLSTITLPASVETIKGGAFNCCISLQKIFCLSTTPPSLNGYSIFADMGTLIPLIDENT